MSIVLRLNGKTGTAPDLAAVALQVRSCEGYVFENAEGENMEDIARSSRSCSVREG